MFRVPFRQKVGRFGVATENGVIYVSDGIRVYKAVVEMSLDRLTRGRVKAIVNMEKLFYGVAVPILKTEEKVILNRHLAYAEQHIFDTLVNYLLTTEYIDGTTLKNALTLKGFTINVQHKNLMAVA